MCSQIHPTRKSPSRPECQRAPGDSKGSEGHPWLLWHCSRGVRTRSPRAGKERLTARGRPSPSHTGGGRTGSCQAGTMWCVVSATGWWPRAPRRSAGSSSAPAGTWARAGSSPQPRSSAGRRPWRSRWGKTTAEKRGEAKNGWQTRVQSSWAWEQETHR